MLDAELAGEQIRGVKDRRCRQPQHGGAGSKKNALKPHLEQQWVIPPEQSGAFVAAMEEILAVYMRPPRDTKHPLVCPDEASKQLILEIRASIPMRPGRPARSDYEYERI